MRVVRRSRFDHLGGQSPGPPCWPHSACCLHYAGECLCRRASAPRGGEVPSPELACPVAHVSIRLASLRLLQCTGRPELCCVSLPVFPIGTFRDGHAAKMPPGSRQKILNGPRVQRISSISSLAMFTAMRRASSWVMSLAAVRREKAARQSTGDLRQTDLASRRPR